MSPTVAPENKLSATEGAAPRGVLRALSVAPMMARTDRHFRVFMRKITRHTLLYTEMVTMNAIIHGDREHLLGFDPVEGPLALQLGGNDPAKLAECARIAQDRGYDEVNLNVGCPSDRVQSGQFGACLMAQPDLVARCVEAMRAAVTLPITVKHRIGIDELDRYEDMRHFVDVVAAAGSDRFTVHARKAWLQGLSPKENRSVPPLRYEDVYRIKAERPELMFEINGGICSLESTLKHLERVDAVMIGRAAYDNPYLFARADRDVFGASTEPPSRREVVEAMYPYIERVTSQGVKLNKLTRHMVTLFKGQPGTGFWKRYISEHAHLPGAGIEVLEAALAGVP